MTDPELKERHRMRRKRNLLAKELRDRKFRQRIVLDKQEKPKRITPRDVELPEFYEE